MEFRILGPLEVVDQGRLVKLGGAKQRSLLAFLLLHPNEVVSRDRVIDELWPDRPPGAAGHNLDVQVSRLRKLIEPDPTTPRYLQTVWGFGYVFVPDEVPSNSPADTGAGP